MDLLNEAILLKTKSTLFNLLIRKTSTFLCYERLLNMTYVANKNAFSREMQFWSHCYTVVSYQALFRLSVYKIPAVYLSGAKNVCFCTIRDFGSPTITVVNAIKSLKQYFYYIEIDVYTLAKKNSLRINWESHIPSERGTDCKRSS